VFLDRLHLCPTLGASTHNKHRPFVSYTDTLQQAFHFATPAPFLVASFLIVYAEVHIHYARVSITRHLPCPFSFESIPFVRFYSECTYFIYIPPSFYLMILFVSVNLFDLLYSWTFFSHSVGKSSVDTTNAAVNVIRCIKHQFDG